MEIILYVIVIVLAFLMISKFEFNTAKPEIEAEYWEPNGIEENNEIPEFEFQLIPKNELAEGLLEQIAGELAGEDVGEKHPEKYPSTEMKEPYKEKKDFLKDQARYESNKQV